MTILTPHQPEEKHLAEVMEIMREMGAPAIKVYYDGEVYYALEGCHRVAAAHELGIEPILVELDYEDVLGEHDFEDLPEDATVENLMDYAYSTGRGNGIYKF